MPNSYFPSNYKNEINLDKISNFIFDFKTQLIKRLKSKWNLLFLQSPKIKLKDSKYSNIRNINFDNKENKCIYEILNTPDQYLARKTYELQTNWYSGVISEYMKWYRDAILENNEFILSSYIDIRVRIDDNNRNIASLYEISLEIWNEIRNIFIDLNRQAKLNLNDELLHQTISLSKNKDFKRWYQFLKIDDFLKQKTNKKTLVLFEKKHQIFSKYLNYIYPNDDYSNASELLCFYDLTKEIYPIMEINHSKIIDEKNYIHIAINIDKLIMIILKKAHLAEIIPGEWPENLKKEARNKKVEIL